MNGDNTISRDEHYFDLVEIMSKNLTPAQSNDLRKTLLELKISSKDNEMLQIINLLLAYKGFYDAIPKRIEEAAATIEKLMKGVEPDIEAGVAALEGLHGVVKNMLGNIENVATDNVRTTYRVLEEGIRTESQKFIDDIKKNILEGLREPLSTPVKEIKEASVVFTDGINKNVKIVHDNLDISSKMLDNTKNILAVITRAKRIHYGIISIFVIIAILASWIYFHSNYNTRLAEERIRIASEMDSNNAVLLELSKSGRILTLTKSSGGKKLLTMPFAKSWGQEGSGVIEFD